MGPALDLAMRRHRTPAPDLEKEALKQAKLGKKKVLPCALGPSFNVLYQLKLGEERVLTGSHIVLCILLTEGAITQAHTERCWGCGKFGT